MSSARLPGPPVWRIPPSIRVALPSVKVTGRVRRVTLGVRVRHVVEVRVCNNTQLPVTAYITVKSYPGMRVIESKKIVVEPGRCATYETKPLAVPGVYVEATVRGRGWERRFSRTVLLSPPPRPAPPRTPRRALYPLPMPSPWSPPGGRAPARRRTTPGIRRIVPAPLPAPWVARLQARLVGDKLLLELRHPAGSGEAEIVVYGPGDVELLRHVTTVVGAKKVVIELSPLQASMLQKGGRIVVVYKAGGETYSEEYTI